MGACYSISAKFKIKDEKKFIGLSNSYIEEKERLGVRFADKVNRSTFKGILETIFTQQEAQFKKTGELYQYHSDFDTCYSWESIMYDFLIAVAPSLKDNSSLYISLDNDEYTLIVQGGNVV
jgi:adenylosuccinate synthase